MEFHDDRNLDAKQPEASYDSKAFRASDGLVAECGMTRVSPVKVFLISAHADALRMSSRSVLRCQKDATCLCL